MTAHITPDTEQRPTCEDLESDDYDGAFGNMPSNVFDNADDDGIFDDDDGWW